MNRKSFLVGLLAAGCFVATSTLMTSPGNAQADPKVAKAMAILKAETAKLGEPKTEGTDQTADKTTPGLYFGSTKVRVQSISATPLAVYRPAFRSPRSFADV